ncbi:hypothetical protein CCP4SC76_5610002 [Gammaproteobacteria bacterium]
MRVNRTAALGGSYDVAVSANPTCTSPLALTGSIAAQDLAGWTNTLACTLPQGTGSITRSNCAISSVASGCGTAGLTNATVTVTVQWDEMKTSCLPGSTDTACQGTQLLQTFSMVTDL